MFADENLGQQLQFSYHKINFERGENAIDVIDIIELSF